MVTETTEQDLKPCPFCGSKGIIKTYRCVTDYKWVECEKCFAIAPSLDQWNEQACDDQIQALKTQLGKCLIQENETLAIAAAHGWEYDPDNYTDEKAMKAYREWEARP